MAGTIIPLFPRRVFTYTSVAGASNVETILIKAIDATQYTSGTLVVRVHTNTTIGTGATLDVLVKATAPTAEDPVNDFVDATALATASVTNTVASNKPALVLATLTAGFPAMLQISIKATQPASAQTIKGELSAELVLKV
ncbi:hypothetical protein ACNOYE_15020 [Nannocystaceae bacterium ST9]